MGHKGPGTLTVPEHTLSKNELFLVGKSIRTGLLPQFLLTHLLAASASIGTYLLARHFSWLPTDAFLAAIAAGGLTGLLLTSNIYYLLSMIELAVTGMAEDRPLQSLAHFWSWPLTPLFQQLRRLNQRLQELTVQEGTELLLRAQLLQQASEAAALEERTRIARDLHDSIKQQIFSISMSAAAALGQQTKDDSASREAIEDIQQSAKEAQVEMQALLQQLSTTPLERTSLPEALRTQGQALGYRTGAQVVVEIAPLPPPDRLLPGTQETLFRMAQEAFANIARHARAHNVRLHISHSEDSLRMEIEDDGQGYDPKTAQAGMGIANMRERVAALKGTFMLESTPGKGTHLLMTIPLVQTLRTTQEKEQERLELHHLQEQAAYGFQLAENIIPLAILLILIYNFVAVPFAVIALCSLIALYGGIQGHVYRTRLAIRMEENSLEMIRLRRSEYAIACSGLLLGTFACVYLFFSLDLQRYLYWGTSLSPYGIVGILAFIILFVGLGVALRRSLHRIENTLLGMLPRREALLELKYKQRRNLRRWRVWTVCTIALILEHHFVFGLPLTFSQWDSYTTTFGIVIGATIFSLDFLHITRWQRRFRAHE